MWLAPPAAPLEPVAGGPVTWRRAPVTLDVVRPTAAGLREQVIRYDPAHAATESQRALDVAWRDWALRHIDEPGDGTWTGSVTCLRWGDVTVVAMPGEPFAAQAGAVRNLLGDPGAIVIGYTNGCPGYIPTADEYPLGGYEVDDAYHYYNMPGPFAPDSAGRLLRAVQLCT